MSELIDRKANTLDIRIKLLGTVSAFAFLCSGCTAIAGSADKTVIWLELGGQLERIDASPERFIPPFVSNFVPGQLTSPLNIEKSSRYSNGGEGTRIKFEPAGSNWNASVSMRYGRTESKRHIHEEYAFSHRPQTPEHNVQYESQIANVEDTTAADWETHAIVDFEIGHDVGLGLFGASSTSEIDLGLRAAQFQSKATSTIYARPDSHLEPFHLGQHILYVNFHHNYYSTAAINRNSAGLGPSVAWTGIIPVGSENQGSQLEIDWGTNASILFGRQRVIAQHKTVARYRYTDEGYEYTTQTRTAHPHRARNTMIPNVGGFAGITYRIDNFKVSAGYRGDFFFGAMDGGIDSRKSSTIGLYGPFATISVGLGG